MSELKFPCPACGQKIACDSALAGTDTTCPNCKALIGVPGEFTASAGAFAPPSLPPSGADQSTAPAATSGVQSGIPSVQRTSGLAIASLVCSLSSPVTCVGWLPGVICGHLAKSRIQRNPALKGIGLATAGLTIGYLILLIETASGGFYAWKISSAVKQGYDNARNEMATNPIVVVQTHPQTPEARPPTPAQSAAPASANPVDTSGWTTDLDQMTFPNHPVAGELRGYDFKYRNAVLRPGGLRITGAKRMFLDIRGLGDAIEGKSFEVNTTDEGKTNPRVQMTWSEGDTSPTVVFAKGYAMKLQFDQAVNGVAPGRIYLCFPDDSKSWVAGTIKVRLPRQK